MYLAPQLVYWGAVLSPRLPFILSAAEGSKVFYMELLT
jgi:hypothetical protein